MNSCRKYDDINYSDDDAMDLPKWHFMAITALVNITYCSENTQCKRTQVFSFQQ